MAQERGISETLVDIPETILDVPETVLDEGVCPILPAQDVAFDAASAATTEGRMAACASAETFTLHVRERLGSGSQGVVVKATDSAGRAYAAKISHLAPTAKDRRNRKAVLDYLVSLMDEHPLGEKHFTQTHLMPVYAYGTIEGVVESEKVYEVVVMPLADGCLGASGGCDYAELHDRVIPQTAAGIRNLHVQGIVHRDIKPKNLYLIEGAVVLGDYGISSFLDAGRDTGATVFDKRTPGYSPHSSVIQRENDWYALGYTIWTLYNGGAHPHQALIDAGDLSAVLAGKRPVEFVPKNPGEASLGELVYGLTLESSRGRLGYDDIQEWLDDPASFRFDNPFEGGPKTKGYQFKGQVFHDRGLLADAMANAWEEAKGHVYSRTLEKHFQEVGQHDLAVALHGIVVDDAIASDDKDFGLSLVLTEIKGSSETFVWRGTWERREGVADETFARISSEPSAFYETCGKPDAVREMLERLIVAYSGEGGRPELGRLVRQAMEGLDDGGKDVLLVGDKLLTLFDLICDDKAAVRSFYVEYGMYGDAVWAKRHIDVYRAATDEARDALRELRAVRLPNVERVALDGIRTILGKLDAKASQVFAMLPANPFERMLGTAEAGSIRVSDAEAYRCARAYGETCSIGFARSVVAPGERDSVCDFSALRKQAADAARADAESVKRKAEAYSAPRTVDGHSKLWHVALMACTIGLLYYGWGYIEGVARACKASFAKYAPSMKAGGGFSPDVPLFGTLCDFSIDLALCGFVVACVCVLVLRLLQLVPAVSASLVKRYSMSVANGVLAKVRALEAQPIDKSIAALLRGSVGGSADRLQGVSRLLEGTGVQFPRAVRAVNIAYRVAVVLLMVGIVGSVIESAPFNLFQGTIMDNTDKLAFFLPALQVTLTVLVAIYDAIVLKVSGFKPNAIAVLFVILFWAFLCTFL